MTLHLLHAVVIALALGVGLFGSDEVMAVSPKPEVNKKFEPHSFAAQAAWTDQGLVKVSLRVQELADNGKPIKIVAAPTITVGEGQHGVIKLQEGDQVLRFSVVKPIHGRHVLVLMTIEQGGKVMAAEAKAVGLAVKGEKIA